MFGHAEANWTLGLESYFISVGLAGGRVEDAVLGEATRIHIATVDLQSGLGLNS